MSAPFRPEPTKAPDPTATPEPTKAPEPMATPEPTKIPELTATPIPTATPTEAPKPEVSYVTDLYIERPQMTPCVLENQRSAI